LDNSAVHPEAYSIVEKCQRFEVESNLIANKEKTALIKPENYVLLR
jgi:uncharacterized protein